MFALVPLFRGTCQGPRQVFKWDRVALDANNTVYRGQHLWVSDDPPLHGTISRVAHTGPGPHDCPCGGGLETRSHILFHCPCWVQTKALAPLPRTPPFDARTRQLRDQRGWSADDVLEFLRLNPMVSAFGWSEILAEALSDRADGRPHSRANARLQAHTTERVFRWRRFYQSRNQVAELAYSLSDDFEARADNLLVLWEELDAEEALLSPVLA